MCTHLTEGERTKFQFFTNSNGNVGMNGELLVLDDGVKPGAKKLESVIGTVTAKGKEQKFIK